MGYHQLHAPPLHVNSEIQSPTLAKFARDGVVLSSYYSYKYCGPSRASLLTGRLPGHGISEMMWSPAQPGGYNANLTMLSAKLRGVGYRTVGLGKWHCGFFQPRFLPTERGFDHFVGYLSGSEDHYTQRTGDNCGNATAPRPVQAVDLWRGDADAGPAGGAPARGLNGTYSAYTYTGLAVDAIERFTGKNSSHADRPLFLYLALQDVHGPDEVEPRFEALYDASMYGPRRVKNAMVSVVDEALRNVTAALARAGIENNTLVLVVSDNGSPIQEPGGQPSTGNNWPLRGGESICFCLLLLAFARVCLLVLEMFLPAVWLAICSDSPCAPLCGFGSVFHYSCGSAAGKYGFFEGGVRVVGMVRYPARLRGGRVWDGLAHASDWYATLSRLGGASADDTGEAPGPIRVPVDGMDLMDALASDAPSPRTELILGLGNRDSRMTPNGAYINETGQGRLKLIVGRQRPWSWVGPRYPNASTPSTVWPPALDCSPGCLFNLTEDPSEGVDIAAQHPVLAARMAARYNELRNALLKPNDDDGGYGNGGYAPGNDEHAGGHSSAALGNTEPTDPAACRAMEAAGGFWVPWSNITTARVHE